MTGLPASKGAERAEWPYSERADWYRFAQTTAVSIEGAAAMPAYYRRPDAKPPARLRIASWLPLSSAALTDRRAVDTTEELAGARRRQMVASARFALNRDQPPERLQAERELEEIEETIVALEATLRERPWTEA